MTVSAAAKCHNKVFCAGNQFVVRGAHSLTQLNLQESMAITDMQKCYIFKWHKRPITSHMLSHAARMMEEEAAAGAEEEEEEEEEGGRSMQRTLAPLVATCAALPAPPLQRLSHTVMHPWKKKKVRGLRLGSIA